MVFGTDINLRVASYISGRYITGILRVCIHGIRLFEIKRNLRAGMIGSLSKECFGKSYAITKKMTLALTGNPIKMARQAILSLSVNLWCFF